MSTVEHALAARFLYGQYTRFLEGEDRSSACVSATGRRFDTPAEARAFDRGFTDFPRIVESGPAYRLGWHEAEQRGDPNP